MPDASYLLEEARALYQAARVARLRKLPLAAVQALVEAQGAGRLFGFIGEPRVKVLQLNLALDEIRR